MPVFSYEALDPHTCSSVRGTIAADTPRCARDLLRLRGLRIEQLRSFADRPRRHMPAILARRLQDQRRVVPFIRELAMLLGVGVPLLEALDAAIRQQRGRFRTALLAIRERVAGGAGLAEAMGEHPRTFDPLCVQIVRVGEDAGSLDVALERLARFKERSRQLKGRVGNALIYPAIVLGVAAAVSVFLMSFVVPNILQPLLESGRPLPWPTRVVKGASDLLVAWWWAGGLILAAVFAIASLILSKPAGKRAMQALMMRLPLVGELIQKAAIVRMAVVMSTLLRSGMVFVRAMEIAQQTTSNLLFSDAMARCQESISAGEEIACALEQTGVFPPAVVQVFAVGQQSGRLEEILDQLASDWDEEVSIGCQRLASFLEPLLIIILALLILLIAMATMLPILEAGDVLQ